MESGKRKQKEKVRITVSTQASGLPSGDPVEPHDAARFVLLGFVNGRRYHFLQQVHLQPLLRGSEELAVPLPPANMRHVHHRAVLYDSTQGLKQRVEQLRKACIRSVSVN